MMSRKKSAHYQRFISYWIYRIETLRGEEKKGSNKIDPFFILMTVYYFGEDLVAGLGNASASVNS